MILDISILVFILMETANVVILYISPGFKYGNSMAAFQSWEENQGDETQRLYQAYLVRWVANCKVIFLALLGVVLAAGTREIKMYAVGVTIFSIGIYFLTLHPLILRLDRMGQIKPKGYSKTLGVMIAGFMVMFSLALVAQVFLV